MSEPTPAEPVPAPAPIPTPASSRPIEVDRAFWLWIASVLFATVQSVIESIEQFVRLNRQQESWFDLTLSMALALLWLAVTILVGLRMRHGRNWARAVIVGLTALDVAGLVWSAYYGFRFTSAWSVVNPVLDLVVVVLLFRPAARAWFARRELGTPAAPSGD